MSSLKSLVAAASTAYDRVVTPPPGITVLIYHQVGGGTDSAVDLPPEAFDRQLEHLREHHRVLTLDQAVDELRTGQPCGWETAADGPSNPAHDGRRGVVITFDDGTADFGDVVVPALVRHELPATLYVATKFVDEREPFPWGAPPVDWQALRDAASTGLITLGSHTHSHWLLDRLDRDTIDDDLDRSIELLAEHTATRPHHFAYPKAVPGSPTAEIAVRRRFDSAALAANRVNRIGRTDVHRLWRTPIQRTDDAASFACKAYGVYRLEGELRSATARVRYRNAVR